MTDGFTPEVYQTIINAMLSFVTGATIPILVAQPGMEPKQHATGTLFQIADFHFLISAGHAAGLAREPEAPLYIAPTADVGDSIQITGTTNVTAKRQQSGVDDPFDLVVWRLDEETVSALSRRQFLRRDVIDADADLTEGTYFLLGYPSEWSLMDEHAIVQVSGGGFCAHSVDSSSHNLENFNSRYHILLEGRVALSDGRSARSLSGISGASIWKTNYVSGSKSQWSPNDAHIVAVQTCVYRNKHLVRGTIWKAVFTMIADRYPELAGPLSIALPRLRVSAHSP